MVPALRIPRRLIAPIVLIALVVAIWASGVTKHLSWSGVAQYHAALTAWVAAWPWLAPFLFVAGYTMSVTLSLPQAALLTMTGGLLFGTVTGGALAVTGATIGAIFLFLIARSAFADSMARRGGVALGKLRDELRRNGFSYLLAIRLVPIFPFWLVNLAAAACGMRLIPFALATLLGIIPGTLVFAAIGAGVAEVLANGGTPDFSVVFSPHVLLPLLGLAALTLLPVAWQAFRGRSTPGREAPDRGPTGRDA
jgi:uncharacterized membrane protein YdjX (TVP38/TMEM64 family)